MGLNKQKAQFHRDDPLLLDQRMKDEGTAAVKITSMMKRNSCGKALDVARDMLAAMGFRTSSA